jgi:hypothetical protein
VKDGLWKDNPATPAQRELTFIKGKPSNGRVTQSDVMLRLLRDARSENRSLTLPQILDTHIAQFTARIYELRKRGFTIENEMERNSGTVRSSYRLIFDPERDA